MISKIIWELREDRSIKKVTKLTNRLYANSKASAEYNLISDAILPTDTVKMILTVGEKEYHKLLAYGNVLLETGETVKGWSIVSNGEELAVEIEDNGYETMIVAFEIKRFSSLDSQTLLTSFTSPQDTVLIYASSSYTPMVEPTDAELLENEISKINVKLDDKVDKVSEYAGDGISPAIKGEILNVGIVSLSSSTTNLEENISKTLAVTPYDVSILTNGVDSDPVVTETQLTTKVDKKVSYIYEGTDAGYDTVIDYEATINNTGNSIIIDNKKNKDSGDFIYRNEIMLNQVKPNMPSSSKPSVSISSYRENYKSGKMLTITPNSIKIHNKTSNSDTWSLGEDVATQPYVDNKSQADRLYVDTKIDAIKKSVGYIFDTFDNFTKWIAGTYVRDDGVVVNDLNIGDDIFIVEEGVPDYWVRSKSDPMTITDFAPYESGDYKPTITWLEG